ncbi:N-(5'-phosphoribosyl)anthranilate isomerase [Planktothrix tepida]|uniref:N-(5'-phosphoribosyl)anthranilate isomerase n=2 Tax=Planktothrix TaxID=54304 RepID=A0A1J1LMH4_9CYAN|nr:MULTISPECIES: phosphoribosylanthranilate isomerase [Planktothrix]CAD5936492.1 N-(5'-phosphoribosyl)anthranilate isomerase [Planktothrix tepida]CAD5975023.1 N-(5'-phosphoribosyl)anthranilate isomerase [Planktothrix pseudagardhii]CUR33398.1 N-(5'-phosphoribosyl)anthranilate isomerase [Planktothrix tepida PCC 9214]
MRIKICGITQPDQGSAIAQLGVTVLGFICVPSSPRYVTSAQIRNILKDLPNAVQTIGVFANASLEQIHQTVMETGLTGVQLHGHESPDFCDRLRQILPQIELIKAFRIQSQATLLQTQNYFNFIDTLLLDAYHPQQLGGTGHTLDWQSLQQFSPPCSWFLAGGLTPDNIQDALQQLKPDGIDLSSGVERSPGDKDLAKVRQLLKAIEMSSLRLKTPNIA